ncbi:LOW QUALITY PROTEIN: serine/threonine-protein kinase Nek1 [Thalassophryne amazonica]|uniref:LOW QUALITY PROTEIN: serine/threonine-protein kinase Nek1 n=1 Tax=Thalassophryne amazonica TaxID=390379 RepID=UPI001470BD0F|nr:LOW QUALITY PROTEIN: serine/threonine-protein kinase Nek1 [Thalassophryne amazonica]
MNKFEKLKNIGEGSFGKAILVRSKEDGHQYVIKEIGICRMSSKERQESRKEVAVLANMSHPNIVQYKESFEEGGCLYIVMDYCEGGDLFKKINSQKGVLFSEEQILDWFVQICLALKHVHDRKILHRDIKSQNIFLTKDGTIQLGDFGIARVLNNTVELAKTCIGTPYYLSPEICENKPYNNKSDVWALGCVLYEMCTLKHAFEAGNMKNLVLKIIRGSYPPVSVHYSQDLRALLGQLFKRSPRERPSVNSILDKPFLCWRIERFLSPQIIAQEFHHSFVHKQSKMDVVQVSAAKRPSPGSIPLAPAQKITKPAAKYRVPLTVRKVLDGAKKPGVRKPAVKHKPGSVPAAPQRRISQIEEQRKKHELQDSIRRKRLELNEKERKRKEQASLNFKIISSLLKAEQMRRYEKEKVNRIHQAREQGWKHILSSSGGSSPEKKCFVGVKKRALGVHPCPVPDSFQGLTPNVDQSKTAVDQVVKQQQQQPKEASGEEASTEAGSPTRGVPSATGPVVPNAPTRVLNPNAIRRELRRMQQPSKHAHISRQQIAAERTYQVEEFLQRKREAMLNKVRAEGQLGIRQNLAAIYGCRAASVRCRRSRANKEEEEYLARLKQIRLQNFNERQQIKARLRGEKLFQYDIEGSDSQDPTEEAELRRKKIEALKAQANARAAVLKEQLEKKRREAYEREKRAWEDHLVARGLKVAVPAGNSAAAIAVSSTSDCSAPQSGSFPPESAAKPSAVPASKPSIPAISMTVALKNVGAVTPLKEPQPESEVSAVIQSEKKQILYRVNQNLKAQSSLEETLEEDVLPPPTEPSSAPQHIHPVTEERPPSNGDRKKWDRSQLPVLAVAQQTLEDTCSTTIAATLVPPEDRPSSAGDRKKWEAGVPFVLPVHQKTLEETCIWTIEETTGEVIQMGILSAEAPKKLWGMSPSGLQETELQPVTEQPENVSICEEEISSTAKPDQAAAAEIMRTTEEVLISTLVPPVKVQIKDAAAAEVSNKETVLAKQTLPPHLTGTQDASDIESVVLEECPQQVSHHLPAGLQQAWEQEAQQPKPLEGNTRPACIEEEKHVEKATEPPGVRLCEEQLFMKLCSPAHRRTAALAVLSAQSSMDESSSSLASRSRSVSPLRSKNRDAFLIGLSTGMFDANNPKMLRTCSLPDLRRLPKVSSEAAVAPDNNLESEDLDEADKEDDDQSETEDVFEDDDLQDVRASMERLLQEEEVLMRRPAEVGGRDFSGNRPEGDDQVLFNRIAAEIGDNHHLGVDDDNDDVEEECSNGSPGDEEAGELLSNGDETHSNNSQLNEEWHSDGTEEDQGAESEHHDSIFSRLEELRFNLEQQMGFEKLVEAYNKIKAIHEDEDENIDLGSSMVLSILGTEHQHLYPNILHLVMGDGAYQEDNDE